ncbi:calcium-translocating P-type ATPase, SERCA-type [Prosthecochloris sp.]|uniref:calcium-translocating P-type ATPase, SERCA-type n=1 Tax=Prosthecochloris sp. TaxID=290513 RepID=UPI0025DAFBC0|nr:calcium-translocating P-type ATPase, SERCA-type [Prosthecochloris sp.]
METFSESAEKILQKLQVTPDGLTSEEAARRLKRYGENRLREEEKISVWAIFRQQFQSVLVWLLIVAVLISLLLGDVLESVVIGFILVANSVIGFLQEFRAEKALEALKRISGLKAKVLRDGHVVKLETRLLVPGDIILLETGDRIPADARLLELMNLESQESMLTGESTPVNKTTEEVSPEAPLAERFNMVYSGTIVAKGRAMAVVTGTGMETELGRIAELLADEKDGRRSPLQKKINRFSRRLALIVIVAAVLMFLLTWLSGEDLLETFKTALSLAVAAIPEGLPAVVALTLAKGVQRMVKKNAIVRHLPAIETLGSSSVICSDKTGTMTVNRMSVRKIYADGSELEVGEGNPSEAAGAQDLELLFRIGALCNDARPDPDGGIFGDPTEAALLLSAKQHGLDSLELQGRYPRIDEIGFDSERKMMSTLHDVSGAGMVMYTKGAPDVLLMQCTHVMMNNQEVPLDDALYRDILQKNEAFAQNALRVLGFAWKRVHSRDDFTENNLVFAGLQAMNDPPRQEVIDAVARCRSAGIKVVMITGDQKLTAEAIGRELGITGRAMTGADLEEIDDIGEVVEDVSIFARVSPEQKINIVEALQKKDHVVAMTGDGVNDAPALKQADIGVAMGRGGTDVAREASTMVLTDDNFASIVKAVEEGRAIFDNLRKFVFSLLAGNISEVMIIILAVLVGLKLPLVAIQILWINLVTDGLPALALGFEPKAPNIMRRPPVARLSFIVDRLMIIRLVVVCFVITAGCLGLYINALYSTGWSWGEALDSASPDYLYASTMAFTSLVILEMVNAFHAKSETENIFTLKAFSNPWLTGAVAFSLVLHLVVLYSPLNHVFHSVPLGIADWGIILGVSAVLILADSIFKTVVKQRQAGVWR